MNVIKRTLVGSTLLISTFASAYDLTIKMPDSPSITLSIESMKAKLPVSSFSTETPWTPKGEETLFSGFSVMDLLIYIGASSVSTVSFTALNDYSASASIDDLMKYDPIIAYSMNGKPMKVKDKGPLWFIYDMSSYPKTDKASYHNQMVWQIKEITINTHD